MLTTYIFLFYNFLLIGKSDKLPTQEEENELSENWESLHFQIATNISAYGSKCLMLSYYFCLISWRTTERRPRNIGIRDRIDFWQMANRTYEKYNWYSLGDLDFGYCCNYQTSTYVVRGMQHGFTPFQETFF